MNPIFLAEGLRRSHHRRGRPRSIRPRDPSTSRLLLGELGHLLRLVARPRAVVVAAGLVTAVGVFVALGPGYPGPVAPSGARAVLTLSVAVGGLGLARSAPPRWSGVRRAVRRQRLGMAVALASALIALVKVGLHEMTPGPAVGAPWRWTTVTVAAAIGVAVTVRRGDRGPDGA